jgi:PAS domain S-box-containing protein
MWKSKRPYASPQLHKYPSLFELPERLRQAVTDLVLATENLTAIVDDQRRYLSVSPHFASSLGYASEELLGKRIDDITAAGTVDIEFVFDAFRKLGEMDGLWVFQDRQGKKLLFHYRARRLEDQLIYAELEPLPLAG